MAFEKLEPWGFRPEQLRAGQICAIIANVNRKKGTPAYKAEHFLQVEGYGSGPEKRESARSIHAKAQLITELYAAAQVKRGDDR